MLEASTSQPSSVVLRSSPHIQSQGARPPNALELRRKSPEFSVDGFKQPNKHSQMHAIDIHDLQLQKSYFTKEDYFQEDKDSSPKSGPRSYNLNDQRFIRKQRDYAQEFLHYKSNKGFMGKETKTNEIMKEVLFPHIYQNAEQQTTSVARKSGGGAR